MQDCVHSIVKPYPHIGKVVCHAVFRPLIQILLKYSVKFSCWTFVPLVGCPSETTVWAYLISQSISRITKWTRPNDAKKQQTTTTTRQPRIETKEQNSNRLMEMMTRRVHRLSCNYANPGEWIPLWKHLHVHTSNPVFGVHKYRKIWLNILTIAMVNISLVTAN